MSRGQRPLPVPVQGASLLERRWDGRSHCAAPGVAQSLAGAASDASPFTPRAPVPIARPASKKICAYPKPRIHQERRRPVAR
jgi:hypothetical protein